MFRGFIKYLLLAVTLVSFVNQDNSDLIKDQATFNKCYTFFKDERSFLTKQGNVFLRRIEAGLSNGKNACKQLIYSSFKLRKDPVSSNVTLSVLDEKVFKNLSQMFFNFTRFNKFPNDNQKKGNKEFYDLNELNILYVFNFLLGERPRDMLIGTNQIQYKNNLVFIRTKEKGKLFNHKKKVFSHYGGGVLGHNLYLLFNLGLENNQPQTIGFSTRKYPISVFSDFLCRELPAVSLKDASKSVVKNHPDNIKRSLDCMHCHISMDAITEVVKDLHEEEVEFSVGKAMIVSRSNESKYVSDFNTSEKKGGLIFRNYQKDYISLKVDTLDELGLILGQQPDFDLCMTKKLRKALWGLEGVQVETELKPVDSSLLAQTLNEFTK